MTLTYNRLSAATPPAHLYNVRMCLVLLAWQSHPDYPLILAGNRDEFHARPTDPASFWREAPAVIGGRDLTAGGSWLGVTAAGRFAVVTNYREAVNPPDGARSRGHLVGDFLRGGEAPAVFLSRVAAEEACYAGFNLFAGTPVELDYFSNRDGRPRSLAPGLYALSNATLDAPWPKVERLRARFARLLGKRPDPDALLALLHDREPAPDAELPATGLPPDRERLLSSPFIVSPTYGTRASSVLTIAAGGRTTFVERGFDPDGQPLETRRFHFLVPSLSGRRPEPAPAKAGG